MVGGGIGATFLEDKGPFSLGKTHTEREGEEEKYLPWNLSQVKEEGGNFAMVGFFSFFCWSSCDFNGKQEKLHT